MSILQLQHTLYNLLPQLDEVQLRKLMAFVQSLLPAQKQQPAPKPAAGGKREVKVIADDAFDLEADEIYLAVPFSKTYQVSAKVVAVEKLKPTPIVA